MENQTDSPQPEPSNTPAPELETDPLRALAQAAKAARLAPADEERAVELLKERLTGGRAGVTDAIEPMISGLPWIVCVNAVSAVWEQLSVPMRRHLLASIAKNESESARRLQLSLARAIFKIDPAAGIKLSASAAASLKAPDTGALTAKYRQFFFHVFIGKGKPWLLQLPLGDLKAADADALVHAAIECFSICPPFSQLSILRWAYDAGRLGKKTNAADLETAAKAVTRWNAKLQRQLKAEIAELPPVIEAVLKPEASGAKPEEKAETKPAKEPKAAPKGAEAPSVPAETAAPEPAEAAPAAAPLEELVIPGRAERLAQKEAAKAAKKQPRKPEPSAPDHGRPENGRPERGERERGERERGEKPARSFDFKDALRGVESYVASLRSELEQTKAQLRRKEEAKPERRAARTPEEQSPLEAEALIRHNIRLEATIIELRAQLEDIRSHHESVAESRLLRTGEPLEEGSAEQLKALLGIQLGEGYETYTAMRQEALDKVFRLDYRDLLGTVFDALIAAGVPLNKKLKP